MCAAIFNRRDYSPAPPFSTALNMRLDCGGIASGIMAAVGREGRFLRAGRDWKYAIAKLG
jgi:hypothetical protein